MQKVGFLAKLPLIIWMQGACVTKFFLGVTFILGLGLSPGRWADLDTGTDLAKGKFGPRGGSKGDTGGAGGTTGI